MIYGVLLLFSFASLSLQAPSVDVFRVARGAAYRHFPFTANHTCFTIQKGGYAAIERCLECVNKAYGEDGDQTAAEIPADVKPCFEPLPSLFKPCSDDDPMKLDCFSQGFRKQIRRIMKTFWKAYLFHMNDTERGAIVQFLSWAKFLHKIHEKSEDDYQTINATITPCRDEIIAKIKESRKKRDAEEEEAGEFPSVQDEEGQENEEELDQISRMRTHVGYVLEYLKCKMDAIKGDAAALGIVKNAVKTYTFTIPATMVNELYDC